MNRIKRILLFKTQGYLRDIYRQSNDSIIFSKISRAKNAILTFTKASSYFNLKLYECFPRFKGQQSDLFLTYDSQYTGLFVIADARLQPIETI